MSPQTVGRPRPSCSSAHAVPASSRAALAPAQAFLLQSSTCSPRAGCVSQVTARSRQGHGKPSSLGSFLSSWTYPLAAVSEPRHSGWPFCLLKKCFHGLRRDGVWWLRPPGAHWRTAGGHRCGQALRESEEPESSPGRCWEGACGLPPGGS